MYFSWCFYSLAAFRVPLCSCRAKSARRRTPPTSAPCALRVAQGTTVQGTSVQFTCQKRVHWNCTPWSSCLQAGSANAEDAGNGGHRSHFGRGFGALPLRARGSRQLENGGRGWLEGGSASQKAPSGAKVAEKERAASRDAKSFTRARLHGKRKGPLLSEGACGSSVRCSLRPHLPLRLLRKPRKAWGLVWGGIAGRNRIPLARGLHAFRVGNCALHKFNERQDSSVGSSLVCTEHASSEIIRG